MEKKDQDIKIGYDELINNIYEFRKKVGKVEKTRELVDDLLKTIIDPELPEEPGNS